MLNLDNFELLGAFKHALTVQRLFAGCRAVAVMLFALVLAPVVRRALKRMLLAHIDAGQAMLVGRISTYIIFGVACTWALRELGFELSVLLGAAGAVTFAVGFASQTSISNVISGLFLIGEQPFKLGDVIQIDKITGEVLSIDLLSVKLRTLDNLFVRISNEMVLRSIVINLTRYPIRRYDMDMTIAYHDDIQLVKKILLDVAAQNTLCLEDPAPVCFFLSYGESGLLVQLSAWSKRENFSDMKNSLYVDIKLAFAKHGIQMPYLQRSLHGHLSVTLEKNNT